MDIYDRAQALEELERDAAIRRQRAKFGALSNVPGVDTALECLACGGDIPEARRIALPGTMLCVDCQAAEESKQRRGL